MSAKTQDCPRCGMSGRLQKRTFSDQALAALVVWGELDQKLVSQSICDGCYDELRDILIDRSSEIANMPANFGKAS